MLQEALDVKTKEMETEKESSEKAKMEWEREREAMREEISELRDNMRQNHETLKKMEGKHKVQTSCVGRFPSYLKNVLNFMTTNF